MSEIESFNTMLEELRITLQEKTPDEVITLLRNARKTSVSENQDVQFVIMAVCDQLFVSIDRLINEQGSDDATKYAKGFIVYYLRDEFDIDWKVIKAVLKHKDQSYLWRLMNNVKTLKKHLAAQAIYYQFRSNLNIIIKEYKSKK